VVQRRASNVLAPGSYDQGKGARREIRAHRSDGKRASSSGMIEDPHQLRVQNGAALPQAYEAGLAAAIAGRDTIAVVRSGQARVDLWQRAGAVASGRSVLISAQTKPAGVIPERMLRVDAKLLALKHVLDSLTAEPIGLVVLDGAEALSQWGGAFVPDFLSVAPALRALGHPPVLALTNSLSPTIRDDIARELQLRNPYSAIADFVRPRLRLQVYDARRPIDKRHALRDLLRGELAGQSGIVYAASIGHAETIRDEIARDAGVEAALYHGRLPKEERRRIENAFDAGAVGVVVATAGFGARTRRSDIRFVVHTDLPASLEMHYDEATQAGRNGSPATAVLLYRSADKTVQSYFLTGRYPSVNDVQRFFAMMRHLNRRGDPVGFAELCQFGRLGRVQCKLIVTLLGDAGYVERVGPAQYRVSRLAHDHPQLVDKIANYEFRRSYDESRLLMLLQYAQTRGCRWHFLETYFACTPDGAACGNCDNCLSGAALQAEASGLFAPGEAIEHPKFGAGIVERAERDMVTALFANYGYRTLLASAVRRAVPSGSEN